MCPAKRNIWGAACRTAPHVTACCTARSAWPYGGFPPRRPKRRNSYIQSAAGDLYRLQSVLRRWRQGIAFVSGAVTAVYGGAAVTAVDVKGEMLETDGLFILRPAAHRMPSCPASAWRTAA